MFEGEECVTNQMAEKQQGNQREELEQFHNSLSKLRVCFNLTRVFDWLDIRKMSQGGSEVFFFVSVEFQ